MSELSANPQPPAQGPIGRVKIAIYSAVNLPTAVVGLPISLYIPAFYSENLGLSLAVVGALMALSRLTDVVTDPLIGILSDRWRTRFGRRKPWMVFGTPIKLLALWMLFVPDSAFAVAVWSAMGGDGVTNLYLFVWISILYLGFTLVDLPYKAWGAELSLDYDERSTITGFREAFGYGGLMMALLIPIGVSFLLSRPGAENALHGVAVAVVVLLPLLTLPALGLVPEPHVRPIGTRINWKRGLQIVWRNGPFRRLVFCLMFFVVAIGMSASLSFFFVRRVMEQPFETYALFVLAYYVSSTIAIPVWLRISQKIGKHRAVVAGIGWLSLWSAFIPLLGPDDFVLFVVLMV